MLRGCLLSIIYTTCLDLCFAEGAGSFECPCISSRSAGFASLQQQLIARGMERDYGTQGCRAYDDAAHHVHVCMLFVLYIWLKTRLGAPGLTTRSEKLLVLGAPGIATCVHVFCFIWIGSRSIDLSSLSGN